MYDLVPVGEVLVICIAVVAACITKYIERRRYRKARPYAVQREVLDNSSRIIYK